MSFIIFKTNTGGTIALRPAQIQVVMEEPADAGKSRVVYLVGRNEASENLAVNLDHSLVDVIEAVNKTEMYI